jgi:DNA segregation ATPase FtsK/SpoIIIE, S-DNA-T family
VGGVCRAECVVERRRRDRRRGRAPGGVRAAAGCDLRCAGDQAQGRAGRRSRPVVIDELALYCTAPRPKGQEFSNALRLLVQICRAAGIIVVAATQKPSHDVIPTSLRDLFGFRWALRCATREASDTILGSGWAARGFSAADIDAADRGVGYLLHEGREPVRLRACYLSDSDLEVLAPRAEAIRRAAASPASGQ